MPATACQFELIVEPSPLDSGIWDLTSLESPACPEVFEKAWEQAFSDFPPFSTRMSGGADWGFDSRPLVF
jgi:hypothetical protein